MGAIFEDYAIPAGYKGILYSGGLFFYYDGDDPEYASGAFLGEGDPNICEWYEDLEECIDSLAGIDLGSCFDYPYHDDDFARIVVDGIILSGDEEPGETGWNYERLDQPAYLGEIIRNFD